MYVHFVVGVDRVDVQPSKQYDMVFRVHQQTDHNITGQSRKSESKPGMRLSTAGIILNGN